jgi:hypothetical protein
MKLEPDPEGQIGGATTDEKAIYLNLCEQLTSRKPVPSTLPLEILGRSYNMILSGVDSTDYTDDQKLEIKARIQSMYLDIDQNDPYYIGRINVFMLQLVILFTEYAINKNGAVNQTQFKNTFTYAKGTSYKEYMSLRNGEWETYNGMRTNIQNSASTIKRLYDKVVMYRTEQVYNITSEGATDFLNLILPFDSLNMDETLRSTFRRVAYYGLAMDYIYADGQEYLPYEFLTHDISHGQFSYSSCGHIEQAYERMLDFYNYSHKSSNRISKYRVKLVLYVLVHESNCSFFHDNMTVDEVVYGILDPYSIQNLKKPILRLQDPNDLGGILPSSVKGEDAIVEYLTECAKVYVATYTQWKRKPWLFRKSRRAKARKTKKSRKI